MKIVFREVFYTEDLNFRRIINNAGFAHEVDAEKVTDAVWDTGTRELELLLELDTETGIIKVIS